MRDFVTWLAHNRSTVDRACRSVVESSLVVRVFLCVRSTSSSCSTVAVHWAGRWPDWRCTHFVWRTKDSSSMWRWRFLASAASCWPPCYRCRCSCWGRDIIKMPCEYHPTNVLHDLRVLNTLWKTKTSQSYTWIAKRRHSDDVNVGDMQFSHAKSRHSVMITLWLSEAYNKWAYTIG